MLEDVVDALECPHCGRGMVLAGGTLRCASRHTFDVARQGYVSFSPGKGDTAAMVAARAEFLRAGYYAPIADLVAGETARVADGYVLDLGSGTGYYLASALDASGRSGLALDASKYACRRAAKAHPRIGAVATDVWQRLPVRDGAISVVLDVFAPRNPEEMRRVLNRDGHLVVVTPDPGHLRELVSCLGLLGVDERKQERLDAQFGRFSQQRRQRLEFSMSLHRNDIESAVAMGPNAWHSTVDEVRSRIAKLPSTVDVTASVTVSVYRR